MATCSVYLYKDTKLKDKKNFSIDYIDDYLSPFLIKVITDYQYQRMNVYKKIKINSDQINCSINYLLENSKPNYLMFLQDTVTSGGVATTSKYYYFIESITQISEKTIELELKMDVLNTFNYNTKGTNNTNYSLSDRSLILREHKNRFVKKQTRGKILLNEQERIVCAGCFNGSDFWTERYDSPTYYIDPVTIQEFVNNNGWIGIKFYYTNGSNVFQQYGLEIGGTPCASIIFNNDGIHALNVDGDDIDFVSWELIQRTSLIGIKFLGYGEHDEWSVSEDILELNADSYYTYFFGSADPDDIGNPDKLVIKYKISQLINELYRKIDKYQEGIESVLFKRNETTLYDGDGQVGWYVVYSSSNAVVENPSDTASKYVNPVNVGFYSDVGYSKTTTVSTIKRYFASEVPQIKDTREFILITKSMLGATGYIEVAGVKYYASDIGNDWQECFCLEKVNNNDLTFATFGLIARSENEFFTRQWKQIIAENVSFVDFFGVAYVDLYCGWNLQTSEASKHESIAINSGESTSTFTSPAFEDIDLTDPKLIKIINFPYAPFESLVGLRSISYMPENMVVGTDCLMLYKSQKTQFNRTLQFDNANPLNNLKIDGEFIFNDRQERNIKYESKLYHSDYFYPKFVYDSFSFMFRLEDVDINSFIENYNPHFLVQYICSNNVQSKFAFIFNQYVCEREIQDYNNVLIVERNNEKALYTNAYINYIRSGGFRYDSKNADTQKLANGLQIALTTIGAIASFASSAVTGGAGIAGGVGLLIGTATKTISAIHQAQQNDRAISQKLLEKQNQSTSVSSSEDIDILKAYSGNKAKLCYYKISDYLESALWDLFHYFGYKCQYYGIPNINSRCNFNFVQGEVILKNYTFNDDIANEIVKKWKEGITFFHKGSGNTYDIEQEYENFETNLTEV